MAELILVDWVLMGPGGGKTPENDIPAPENKEFSCENCRCRLAFHLPGVNEGLHTLSTPMPHETMHFGLAAENTVAETLKNMGFRILDRNWRRPWGELDIVAEQAGVIHFIEVKASRSPKSAGFEPYRRAGASKMHKVRRTAKTWLSDSGYGPDTPWQTDIASVTIGQKGPEIELFFNE